MARSAAGRFGHDRLAAPGRGGQRLEVEPGGDGHDGHGQAPVDLGHERLEDAGRVDPELLGRLEAVGRRRRIVVVLVDPVLHLRSGHGDGGRCPPGAHH